jgi:hypothetical protein
MNTDEIIGVELVHRDPAPGTNYTTVIATAGPALKQYSTMLDKLMRFRLTKYMLLYAGYAGHKLSNKLTLFFWAVWASHTRVYGFTFSFLPNVKHIRR